MGFTTRNRKLASGLFMGVDAKGDVAAAYASGPRLYVNKHTARRAAGFGGRVFCIREDSTGVHVTQEFV